MKSHHVFEIPFEVPTPKEPEKPKPAPKEEPVPIVQTVEGTETETLLHTPTVYKISLGNYLYENNVVNNR